MELIFVVNSFSRCKDIATFFIVQIDLIYETIYKNYEFV